ncbi:hypothetical protein KDD17_17365 [Sulfitobacter albidus]|uniref:Tat pathway signal protein n=1 Tax=Sulfitobacter albidus TaxID=2829501 RepID=A0A975PP89_9RHOB|nr:hypothetical protein [Sulfitobacter albidus]QUJ78110.1 hypothetical protein KDD17_17365 [Sulfitobacter albidus]
MAVFATGASAQETTENPTLTLELNRASASDSGGCQVVFFAQNGLGVDVDDVTWRLAVLDNEGVFRNLLSLPLGSLSKGKRRIVQYNLPSPCEDFSEIIVNEVATCEVDGGASNQCMTQLDARSRADIAFGI